MKKPFKLEYLSLFLLCLFHVVLNSVWILRDFSFWYVPHNVYMLTMDCLVKLNQGIFVLYPLYSAIAAVFLKIFGCEYFVFSLVTSLFFIILILSVYGICRAIGYRKAGLLAAFFISFYPIVFATSRWHDYHLPLIAVLALANYILLMANRSSSVIMWLLWVSVFIFGSLMGKSTITETLIFYAGAAGGVVWAFGINIYSLFSKVRKARPIINITCLVFFGAASLLFTWYHINPMPHIPYYFSELHNDRYIMGQNPFLAIFVYFFNIGARQAGTLAVLLFFIALGSFINRGGKYKWFLFLWMFFPLIIFSLIAKKQLYYTNSILPAFAIITAIGIIKIRHKIVKVFTTLVVLLFLIQYYFLSFHNQFLFERYVFFSRYYEALYIQFPAEFCIPPNNQYREKITSLSVKLSDRVSDYLKRNYTKTDIVSIVNGYSDYRFFPRIFIPLFCELYKDNPLNFSSVRGFLYIDKSLGSGAAEQASQSDLDEMGFGYYISAFMSGEFVIVDSAVHGLFDKSQIESAIEPYYDFIGEYDVYKNNSVSLFFKKKTLR